MALPKLLFVGIPGGGKETQAGLIAGFAEVKIGRTKEEISAGAKSADYIFEFYCPQRKAEERLKLESKGNCNSRYIHQKFLEYYRETFFDILKLKRDFQNMYTIQTDKPQEEIFKEVMAVIN